MIRLLICDDVFEARRLVRTILADHPEIEIVGEAEDGRQAVTLAERLQPDVVLMDVVMPLMDGVEATRLIRERVPAARVVAFAGSDQREIVHTMLEAGATAYCVKGAPLWELERAIAGAGQPLLRLAHTLTRSMSERSVATLVAREVAELSGSVVTAVYLYGPESGLTLSATAGTSAAGARPALSESPPGIVLRAHRTSAIAEADGRELAELYRLGRAACSAAVAVPLLADAHPLGVLLTVMPANVQFDVDTELVRAAADLAAGALANERRLAVTHAEARRDPLTGLGNRRAFDEHVDRLLQRAQLTGEPVTLVLFDLDDFKVVNDERGHAAGDRVLVALGRVLLGSVRIDEEVFRIGGDELALVVRGDADAGAAAATRLREAAARQRRMEGLPTLSVGLATFPTDATSKEELNACADAALYAAKAAGKDQLAVYDVIRTPLPAPAAGRSPGFVTPVMPADVRPTRLLVVDDDVNVRQLLRTTFEIIDIAVIEAGSAAEARQRIAVDLPDAIVLDVQMPGEDGFALCRSLKDEARTAHIPVVMLTGLTGPKAEEEARAAGADAFLTKPFSPLELLGTIERVTGRLAEGPFRLMTEERPDEQLLLYAQDIRRLLDVERTQRLLLQAAYEETMTALARALESKDFGTGSHSQRVTRYARELAHAVDATAMRDPSLEYGFLLHDIGKIGIPDSVLQKPGPLTAEERDVMQSHTVLGQQIMRKVALLQGEGLMVIRSHHERWDGGGYPDGLRGDEIALGARIFSVADTLDAMTSDRPYRRALAWREAVEEITRQSGAQFDPGVVTAFHGCEFQLRRIKQDLEAA